jgi:hypothetical protein
MKLKDSSSAQKLEELKSSLKYQELADYYEMIRQRNLEFREKEQKKFELKKKKSYYVNIDINAVCNSWLHKTLFHYCNYFGYEYYCDAKTKQNMVAIKEYHERIEKRYKIVEKKSIKKLIPYQHEEPFETVTDLLVNYHYSINKSQWMITIHGYKNKEQKEYVTIDVVKELNIIMFLKRFEPSHNNIF